MSCKKWPHLSWTLPWLLWTRAAAALLEVQTATEGAARRALLDEVRAWLPPAEALAAATSVGAALVGLDAGALLAGKLADACLLSVNPLEAEKLRRLSETDVARVWVGGKRGSLFF